MKPFNAIVRLTLRNAVRSHIFQILFAFLILCVALVPTTVGGSTATDFIRVSLLYSLWGVGAILSLSALWVGCHVMSADIENYQLHMVVCKPVSRVTIWVAKWTGVCILHLVMLAISAAAIYGVVQWRFAHGEFPESERQKIRDEVMVGRRVFLPDRPDYMKKARDMAKAKILDRQKRGVTLDLSPAAQEKIIRGCFKEVVIRDSELPAGRRKRWVFKNIPKNTGRPFFLRYRPYLGKVSSERQRMTRVLWHVYGARSTGEEKEAAPQKQTEGREEFLPYQLSKWPEQIKSGEFHEKMLPGNLRIVSNDHEVILSVINCDDSEEKHYYQPADGPKLLLEVCGFAGNYTRAVLVLSLQLILMAALSCAFGGFLTLPTAVFVTSSYLLFGAISIFMTDKDYFVSGAVDRVGQFVAHALLTVVIPLQSFEVTDLVAGGELVEWSMIWHLIWFYLLCRALPLVLFGIYMYRRRELGLVIRK